MKLDISERVLQKMAELTAPFVYKNDEKRIVYGPVLIPDEPDTDNDVVTEEHIENVAHKFVEDYGNIDLMHSLNNVGRLVESYILPVDLQVDNDSVVPKGSWVMGVRVTDDNAWQSVKEKKLGGFSIMAMQKTAMKSSEKNVEKESKRVTLADLGDDWIVNAVSLVDEPAVPKAKWIAIKSKSDSNINNNIDIESVKKAVNGSLEHRRKLIDEKLEKTFANYERFPVIHSTMDDSVVFRILDDNDGSHKTFQVGYSLDENGNVEFIDEPKEVRIEENVVQVGNMFGSKGTDGTSINEDDQQEGIMTKFMRSIGLGSRSSEKAGKVISTGNLKKLQQAKEVIDELLSIGEKEREQKNKKREEGAQKMEKEEVQEMINQSIDPVTSKLDDVLKAMKEEAKGNNEEGSNPEGEGTTQKSKDQEGKEDQPSNSEKGAGEKSSDNEESYKELYESVLKQLKSANNKPFSHRISGQDGAEKSKEDEVKKDRNAFGYKG